MGEAIMESSFVQNILLCLQTFMTTVVLFMILGPIAFILGELFPRKWVRYNRFPFNEFSFEKDGSFYRRLRINEWKDRVPDMSILFKWMLPKHAIPQSRSSEYFFVYHNAWGFIASTLYALGNLPFVLIQRYNRPRFKLIMERQNQIDARRKQAEAAKAQEGK